MYKHFRKRKTCINILILNLFRYHEINTSYLWPLQSQKVLKVMAISFQTLISVYVCVHTFFWLTLHIYTLAVKKNYSSSVFLIAWGSHCL